jgi:hypothetical protein
LPPSELIQSANIALRTCFSPALMQMVWAQCCQVHPLLNNLKMRKPLVFLLNLPSVVYQTRKNSRPMLHHHWMMQLLFNHLVAALLPNVFRAQSTETSRPVLKALWVPFAMLASTKTRSQSWKARKIKKCPPLRRLVCDWRLSSSSLWCSSRKSQQLNMSNLSRLSNWNLTQRCSCHWALQPIHLFVGLGSKRQPIGLASTIRHFQPSSLLDSFMKNQALFMDQSINMWTPISWIPHTNPQSWNKHPSI